MNILLTGASGFIGSYFLEKYSEKNFIRKFSFQRDNFDSLDLTKIETIIHLSALVHQMNGASIKQYKEVNIIQTLKLAEKAKLSGIKHFIFMSTIKVYGEESASPYTEESLCHPQDEYGKSKYLAELELQKLNDKDFIVSIIRTPIVYGAGVKGNIKNLLNLIQMMPILPFSNTYNARSMVYVGNLCALIESVIEHHSKGIFLASDDASLSTTEFIQKIAAALGKNIYLIHVPFFEAILHFFAPSLHKRLFESLVINSSYTKERLSFINPYTVDQGIANMIHKESR